ncbi:MAG: glycosyltransferase family 61 protein [Paracoccaceae bacterium]|nr:MAG: glycosyltransferase family 61 protein [Paracoccaceae bacterium]
MAPITARNARAADLAARFPSVVLAPSETYDRAPAGYATEVPNPAMEALNARHASQPVFRCPEARALELPDALVFDAGTAMTAAGDLVLDSFNIGNRRVVNRVDRLDEGTSRLDLPDAVPEFAGTWMLCKKIGSSNYAHILLEMLPRIPLLRAALGARFADIRLILPDPEGRLGEVMGQMLDWLGVGDQVMRTGHDFVGRFERLVVPWNLSSHPFWIHPAAIRSLEDAAADDRADGPERVFISRLDAGKRRLVNEDAVFARLQARWPDMRRVACGDLGFAEQRRVLARARMVVAVMGGSFGNLVFAPRGGRVACLGPAQFTDLFFRNLAAQKGMDYLELRGTPLTDRPHSAFHLSEPMIERLIDHLERP